MGVFLEVEMRGILEVQGVESPGGEPDRAKVEVLEVR